MSASPGWYHDGQGSLRYWDGQAWTVHTRPAEAAALAEAGASGATAVTSASGTAESHGAARHGLSPRTMWTVGVGLAVLVMAGLALAASLALPSMASRDDADPAATSSASTAASGGSGDATATPSPGAAPEEGAVAEDGAALEALVERFVLAWAAGDCTTEWELSTRDWTVADSAVEYCGEQAGGLASAEFVGVRIAGSSIDGEHATVTTVETYDWHGDGELTEETWEYSAVLTAQGWKVAQTRFVS